MPCLGANGNGLAGDGFVSQPTTVQHMHLYNEPFRQIRLVQPFNAFEPERYAMPVCAAVGVLRTILLAAVLCLSLPTESVAASLVVGGTGAALGPVRVLADAFMQSRPDISIEIPSSLGSSGGIQAVGAGALDIGLSSRPLKNKERKAGLKQTTFARSPFVFVTSNRHADPSLTLTELVAIYSGDRAYWSDGARIRLVLRPETDSDTTILESSIDGMETALAKARETPGVPVAYTDQDAMEMAERIPGALTTATLTSILTENRSLMPISIDGVAPTVDNLANGSYRMSKTLYFVTGPKVSSIALDFIRFVQSAAGTSILRDTGNLMIAAEG